MTSFGSRIAASSRKVDNSKRGKAAKIEIRRRIMSELAKTGPVAVFEGFAGAGRMHRDAWTDADEYVGCDLKWYPDKRLAYVCDNRVLLRAIDLHKFNLFDFDAYGNPYEQLDILSARRKAATGEHVGLIVTDGMAKATRLNSQPHAFKKLAGLAKDARMPDAYHQLDSMRRTAIEEVARRMHAELLMMIQHIGKTASKMAYIGVVLRGISDAAEHAAGSGSRSAGTSAGRA